MSRQIQTESCPADGRAHHCLSCRSPIAAGAVVLDFGRHGFQHYPSCDGVVSSAAAVGSVGAGVPRFAGAQPVADLGDAVADELDRQLGRTPNRKGAAPLAESFAATGTGASVDSWGAYLAECEALGPRDLLTGLRPTQDLGDAIAERMAEQRKGY